MLAFFRRCSRSLLVLLTSSRTLPKRLANGAGTTVAQSRAARGQKTCLTPSVVSVLIPRLPMSMRLILAADLGRGRRRKNGIGLASAKVSIQNIGLVPQTCTYSCSMRVVFEWLRGFKTLSVAHVALLHERWCWQSP